MWFLLLALLAQSADFQAEGLKALDSQQYDAAVELFSKAIAAEPKDYSAHFNLALAYSLLGQAAKAIPEYRAALTLKPELYEAELNLGISLLGAKDSAAAIAPLRDAVRQKPAEFRAVFYLAEALLDQKQWTQAAEAYTTALSLNAKSAEAELGLGQALAKGGHPAEADSHYRNAASLDAGFRSYLLELAAVYENHHQPAEAISLYREFPDNPGAQERVGMLTLEAGQVADAIAALENVVSKSPTSANRIALAEAYVKNKQLAKAEPLISQAVIEAPADPQLRLFFGRVLRDQRKFPEAAQQFLTAARLQPASVESWTEAAGVLILFEQYPQALAALDRVRALGAEASGHYFIRAITEERLGLKKDALESYQKFLASNQGKNPDQEFQARQRARILEKELNRK